VANNKRKSKENNFNSVVNGAQYPLSPNKDEDIKLNKLQRS
jgi:hypothetical protein